MIILFFLVNKYKQNATANVGPMVYVYFCAFFLSFEIFTAEVYGHLENGFFFACVVSRCNEFWHTEKKEQNKQMVGVSKGDRDVIRILFSLRG